MSADPVGISPARRIPDTHARCTHTKRDGETEGQVRATGPSDKSERQGTERHAQQRGRAQQWPAPARARMRARPAPARARTCAPAHPRRAAPLRCEGEGERRAMTWKDRMIARRMRTTTTRTVEAAWTRRRWTRSRRPRRTSRRQRARWRRTRWAGGRDDDHMWRWRCGRRRLSLLCEAQARGQQLSGR